MDSERLAVYNWMTTEVLIADAEESVLSAAKKMASKNVGCVVIVKNEKPVGIFTERDILERVVVAQKDYLCTKIGDVMTSNIVTINSQKSYTLACEIVRKNNIRHLPVVDDHGKLVGIISIKDLSGYLKRDK